MERVRATAPFPMPEGYRNVETDERLSADVGGRFLTRRGALRKALRHPPRVPTYHLRIERAGLFDWRVRPYQNVPVRA